MKRQFVVFCLYLLGSTVLSSQNIKGTILDETKSPLQHVIVYSGSSHSHSDENGRFTLNNVTFGDTLFVEYLGFQDFTKSITQEDVNKDVLIIMRPKTFEIGEVTISNSVKAINTISAIDLAVTPVNSSQEILRKVPGLLIGQHAGGGKAEQIFLRGFDIDHGTDIALNVDGIPVNLVSHAHGQGYSDLHFIIPETIENLDFGKGPYYTDIGNFNTAGYVNFKTKDRLYQSKLSLEYGSFNTNRLLGMFSLLDNESDHNAYIATEYQQSDGPFESPQNFNRLNLMAKYSANLDNGDVLSLLVSRMQSRWDASGQIPQRLVDNNTITRFGAVDDTEGGQTSRTNIAANHTKLLKDNMFVKTSAFYSYYDFELFSNFTFFLEDPVNADQIRQYERRNIFGLNTALYESISMQNNRELELSYHVGFRYDDVNDIELSNTLNRKTTLSTLSLGNVDETNIYGAVNANLDLNKWLVSGGVRVDYFNFAYLNSLSTLYDYQAEDRVLVSPKLSLIYNPSNRLQYYLKTGFGFHSNDSRVVIDGEAEIDLPTAYGADLGIVYKPVKNLFVNAALWYLFLEQEFVYVGDAGIVEPSGRTRRQGIDLSLRYQIGNYVFLNTDLTYADPVALDEDEGNNFIPLSVDFMSAGGITVKNYRGFSGGIRYRYIKDRPANEDNSIEALGYFVTDLNLNYAFKRATFGVSVENLFDVDWNEAQFATESRLRDELTPVEELHFTPGVPFYIKGNVTYTF